LASEPHNLRSWLPGCTFNARIFEKFVEYLIKLIKVMEKAGLKLSEDVTTRTKTAYMTNDMNKHDLRLQITDTTTYMIPKLKDNETYKYLGVHYNVELNWTVQIADLEKKVNRTTAFLTKKCFTADQCVNIINKVLKRDLGGMGLNNLAAEVAIRKALDLISHGTDSKDGNTV